MKKRKIKLIPFLFSAVVAAAFFYFVIRGVFLFFWRFDLFTPKHWQLILTRWKSGWVLHKPKEIIFLISLLLLIPGYFLTCFLVYIFPLKKVLLSPITYLKNKKREKLESQSLAAALGPAEKKMPAKQPKKKAPTNKPPSEKQAAINHLRGMKAPGTAAAPSSPGAAGAQGATNDPATRFELWNKLAKELEAAKIFILRHMKINSFSINITAITQEGVFLLCEGPEQSADWETNENATPAVWKSEKGEIPSPLRPMIETKKALTKYFAEKNRKYANLGINCCLILDHGSIKNTDTLLSFLENEDISVLRMGICKTDALPDSNALVSFIKSQGVSSPEINDAVAVAILDLSGAEGGK
ncbi:MAG: hypothetical protein J5787_07125 [Alphaproteobacteria bacterium]|nr:hypothetical protein [Alphaproteobacteria bacterium]